MLSAQFDIDANRHLLRCNYLLKLTVKFLNDLLVTI